MSIGSQPELVHLLALGVLWVALLYAVSLIYTITIERFHNSDWKNDRRRSLLETRSRRRL